jgi:nucleoside-specific outer membrane channel protein Tsx
MKSSQFPYWLPIVTAGLLLNPPTQAIAADWSKTDLIYQHGKLTTPNFAGGGKSPTTLITVQHVSGWQYGDNFIFIDYLNDDNDDNFNNRDFYTEAYVNLSMGKIFDTQVALGPIKDVGAILGINAAADANVLKYLPGLRLAWDLPGFAFFNTDFTAYLDDNQGVREGARNAPAESDSYMIDVSWFYPFSIDAYSFSLGGHMEYIGSRRNEFGNRVEGWILVQPNLRFDLGKALTGKSDTLFVGLKWQYWLNKLGEDDTKDNVLMAILAWRL